MSASASRRFRITIEDRTVYRGEVDAPNKAAARAIAGYLAGEHSLLQRQCYATDHEITVRAVSLIDDGEVAR